ncbi:DUF6531 domain-containing protein [Streptomyces sp. NPDC052040]|uniref:DUF6531 domain-containing protein n=1 Tax=Streptomyces sp. NPDC052040 TaxID=3365682 RepID=UPI0037D718D8
MTWIVQCGTNQKTYDLGQTVTASSGAWAALNPGHEQVVSFSAVVDPVLCANVSDYWTNFFVMPRATVVDESDGGTGGVDTPMYLASDIPESQTYGCASDCSSSSTAFAQPQAQRGASVNTATGAFSGTYTDMQQPSVGGGLDLSRRYSSDNTASGSLGAGWSVPWDAHLAVDASGNVTYTSETGATYPYTKAPDGSFTAPMTTRSVLASRSDGTYTLSTPDKRTLSFDAGGHLASVKNRSGQGVTYGYTGGHAASATDSAGRTSTLTYSGSLLSEAKLADGRHVDYGYTGGRLTSVTGTDGKQVAYGYDTQGRLNSVQDADGHFPVRNTYDTQGRVSSQQDALGNSTAFTYKSGETDTTAPDGGVWTDIYAHNYLLVQYDPFGNRTFNNYDGSGNVSRISDPLGHATSYSYDSSGLLKSQTSASGNTWQYSYDTSSNLTKVTDANAHATFYTYTTGNLLASVKDALGNTTSYTYDSAGRISSGTDPLKNAATYGHDTAGDLTSVTTPSGATATQAFDASGRLVSSTDPRGNASGAKASDYTTGYTYDDADRLLTVTDANGRTTKRSYDDAGNLTSLTDAAGKVTSYGYDAANRVTSVADPAGSSTRQSYDAMGRLISATDATGGTTTYTYDKAGRTASMTTPRGNAQGATASQYTWTYGYDAAGNQTSVTDPAGNTTTTSYNAENRPASVTDPLSHVTQYSYDGVGDVLRVTDALNRTTTSTYNADNQLATVKDAASHTTTYSYDADGRLAAETSPLGDKTTYAYDADGRLSDTVEPRGNASGADPTQYTWHTSYDAAGNAISQKDPLGNNATRTYDAVGNLTAATDGRGKKTTYAYDSLNRLTTVSTPDSSTTTLGYDAVGDMTSRVDGNQHTTTYAYDSNGRLTKVTDPLKRSTSYAYDADGNRTIVTNARGKTITTAYNGRDLPTGVTFSDGTPAVAYTFDAAGRIATLADGTGTRTLTYDADNRPLTITSPGATNPFTYTYNNDGTVKSRTYPDSYATSYTYDADARLTGQTTGGKAITYGYDEAGNLTSTKLPTTTAVTEARTYDRAGRLATVSDGTGVRQLTRDPDGRLTADTPTTGLANRYNYDPAGRLTRTCTDATTSTSCLGGTTGSTYAYDKAGNLTTATTGSSTTTTAYDAANELTTIAATGKSTVTDTYDADGNLTKDTSGSYTYDALSRIASATLGSNTYAFTYDADGNRTTTKKDGTLDRTTRWDVNNPLPQIATDTNASGALIADYTYNPTGAPETLHNTTSTYSLLHDRQDSIRSVLDATGATTSTSSYTAWGRATTTGTGQTSPFGFTGQYTDPYLSGRLALRARSYDPTTTRFATTDPVIADPANPTSSAYAYANDDPANQSDPSGQCPECVSAGIGAALGAVIEGGAYSWQHRHSGFTWGGLAVASGEGAITGAAAGLLMPGAGNAVADAFELTGARAFAASASVNAAVGAGFTWASNQLHCQPTTPGDLLFGAAGGAASSLFEPALNWLKSNRLFMPSVIVSAHTDPNALRLLFRTLGEGETATYIARPGANPNIEPWEHVAGWGRAESPWISLTGNEKVMYGRYGTPTAQYPQNGSWGYVAINRDALTGITHDAAANLPTPQHITDMGLYPAEDARRDSEFLVKDSINPDAIVKSWPAGTSQEEIARDIRELRGY